MTDILFLKKKKILANRTIDIKIKGRLFKNTDILVKYFEGERLAQVCKEGCRNYGQKWSCPPYASPFLRIVEKYSYAFMLVFSTQMKYYWDVKNKYLAVKAANATLKTTIEKCTRDLETYMKGYSLLSGSCRQCKPCQCKKGLPCKHPDKMRYSMEAAGLNVQRLTIDFLDHELLWYKNKTLPEYTSTATLILFDQDLDLDNLAKILEESVRKNIG